MIDYDFYDLWVETQKVLGKALLEVPIPAIHPSRLSRFRQLREERRRPVSRRRSPAGRRLKGYDTLRGVNNKEVKRYLEGRPQHG